jgi:tRNA threonylcarbamoyl adenosine modification protein (Sua5/YciO/YrdC/YwlC family)
MKIIKLQGALKDMNRVHLAKAIRDGSILIYPTDTLYGIGCNAEITSSVEKIAKMKGRGSDKSFSVIAPSKQWIAENSKITSDVFKFIDSLLPGPYTVIVKSRLRTPYMVSSDGKMGIRIPKNEFCDFIRSQSVPFITTSVNLHDTPPVCSIKEIPTAMLQIVDYVIDAGEVGGDSSRIFDISGKDLVIVRW